MAKTVFFGKVEHGFGQGIRCAIGTCYGMTDGGSFSVTQDTAGSLVMRNVLSAIVTPMAGSVIACATGSSSGYVHIAFQPAGTPIPTAGTAVIPLNFVLFGGFGSL